MPAAIALKTVALPLLRELVQGLASARDRVDGGCALWTRLAPSLEAAEALVLTHLEGCAEAEAAELAARLLPLLLLLLRSRASDESADESAAAEPAPPPPPRTKRAREDEEDGTADDGFGPPPAKRTSWAGDVGRADFQAQLERIQRESPKLTPHKLAVLGPPPEAFASSRPPTSLTRVDLRCNDCGIHYALRLGTLPRCRGLSCLCRPGGFDGQLLHCPLDPSVEYHNLARSLAQLRPTVRLVTDQATYEASPGRLVVVECKLCGVAQTRAVGRRLVESELGCRCKAHRRGRCATPAVAVAAA